MKKARGYIFSTPEKRQHVDIEFDFKETLWHGCRVILVDFCKSVTDLVIIPSDLIFDCEVAIAQSLNEKIEDIRINCKIEYQYALIEDNDLESEMLFI